MYAADTTPRILIVDANGQPVRWAALTRTARYYASGKVLTDLGDTNALEKLNLTIQQTEAMRKPAPTSEPPPK